MLWKCLPDLSSEWLFKNKVCLCCQNPSHNYNHFYQNSFHFSYDFLPGPTFKNLRPCIDSTWLRSHIISVLPRFCLADTIDNDIIIKYRPVSAMSNNIFPKWWKNEWNLPSDPEKHFHYKLSLFWCKTDKSLLVSILPIFAKTYHYHSFHLTLWMVPNYTIHAEIPQQFVFWLFEFKTPRRTDTDTNLSTPKHLEHTTLTIWAITEMTIVKTAEKKPSAHMTSGFFSPDPIHMTSIGIDGYMMEHDWRLPISHYNH